MHDAPQRTEGTWKQVPTRLLKAQLLLISGAVGRIDFMTGPHKWPGYYDVPMDHLAQRIRVHSRGLIRTNENDDRLITILSNIKNTYGTRYAVLLDNEPSPETREMMDTFGVEINFNCVAWSIASGLPKHQPPQWGWFVCGRRQDKPKEVAASSSRVRRLLRKTLALQLQSKVDGDNTTNALADLLKPQLQLGTIASCGDARQLNAADPYRGSALPPGSKYMQTAIHIEAFKNGHLEHCRICTPDDRIALSSRNVHEACYWPQCERRLRYGIWWDAVAGEPPPIRKHLPFKQVSPWHESVEHDRFNASKGTAKWEKLPGAVVEIKVHEISGEPAYYCPVKLIIRGADQYKATVALQEAIHEVQAKLKAGTYTDVQAKVEEAAARLLHVPKVRVVMCLNLAFNDFYESARFRYFGIEDVVAGIKGNDWMVVIDLKAYFLTLPLHAKHHRYLTYRCPATGNYKQLHRLPFGARLSPYYASLYSSEIVDCIKGRAATIVRKWRAKRIRGKGPSAKVAWAIRCQASIFVDDLINVSSTKAEAYAGLKIILKVLKELGFKPAPDKMGDAVPTQDKKYLGLRIRTNCMIKGKARVELSLDESKRVFMREQLRQIRSKEHIAGATLESIVGSLSFAALVLRGSRAMISSLYAIKTRYSLVRRGLRHNASWKLDLILLDGEARKDIDWWYTHLAASEWPASVVLDADRLACVLHMKSDASGTKGWGYHTLDEEGKVKWAAGVFTPMQLLAPILALELYPVVKAVSTHGKEWAGTTLVIGVDNTGCAMAVNAQRGRDMYTRKLMKELAELLIKHDIIIFARWCQREKNTIADDLSKGIAYHTAVANLKAQTESL